MLLTTRARGGRAFEGTLGCPTCGARYPVRAGVADLRGGAAPPDQESTRDGWAARSDSVRGSAAEEDIAPADALAARPETEDSSADAALRTAALLALQEVRGVVVLVSPLSHQAYTLARLVPGVEVVTATREEARATGPRDEPGARDESGVRDEPEPRDEPAARVSPVLIARGLPISDRRVAGIALSTRSPVTLAEAVRVVAPGRRVLVTGAGPEVAGELERLGCAVLVHERGVLVAERTGAADPPRLYQLG